mgnify:CR=1 FL=1
MSKPGFWAAAALIGLMCVGCAAARFENLEQGAMAHGIDVEALLKDLNQVVANAATETVTN